MAARPVSLRSPRAWPPTRRIVGATSDENSLAGQSFHAPRARRAPPTRPLRGSPGRPLRGAAHDAAAFMHRDQCPSPALVETVRAERDVAAALGTRERVALGRHGGAARRVIDLLEAPRARARRRGGIRASAPCAGAGTNRCGSSRNTSIAAEPLPSRCSACRRSTPAAASRIASNWPSSSLRTRVGTLPRSGWMSRSPRKCVEPHAPPCRRRADAGAGSQRQPRSAALRERLAAHEQQVGRVDARRDGPDRQLGRRLRRQILEGVHGEVDAPLDERLLDLAHEHALRADRAEQRRRVLVARGLDDGELDGEAEPLERRGDGARLRAREVGAARAEPQGRVARSRVTAAAHAARRRRRCSARRAARRRTRARAAQECLQRAVGAVVQQAAQSQAGMCAKRRASTSAHVSIAARSASPSLSSSFLSSRFTPSCAVRR